MAFAAAALPYMQYAGMAMSAVGSFSASQGNKAAYNAQGQIAENNAVIAGYQAADAIDRGNVSASRTLSKGRQLKGSQRAALAANGVDLGVGSAMHIQDDTDYFSQVDRNTVLNNAAREAWGYRVQAQNFAGNASVLRSRADNESPWLAAGTSLLGSATKAGSYWGSGSDPIGGFMRGTRGSGD